MLEYDEKRLKAVIEALANIEPALTLPLLRTLLVVAKYPSISVNDLADRIDAPQQTASRYVSILQGRYHSVSATENTFINSPLLSQEVSTDDPRRRALFLTSRGKSRVVAFLNRLYEPK